MKKLIIAFVVFILGKNSYAQSYDNDALRYSQSDLGTTARAIGAGGAFSAVGADMSSVSSNPAGLGLYRSNEISLSASYRFGTATTDFQQATTKGNYSKFNMPHGGAVFAINKTKSKHRLSGGRHQFINIGFTFQRLANYNNTVKFAGDNYDNTIGYSIVDDINSNTNPINYNYFSPLVVLAYNTYLVDPDSAGQYFSYVNAPVRQAGTITTKGGMDEVSLSIAGNVEDKFFWGLSLGIPIVNYTRTFSYTENSLVNDTFNDFVSLKYNDSYTVNGAGVNGKFGFIVKPISWFRFGASVKSPSILMLNDVENASFETNYKTMSYIDNTDTVSLSSKYNFRTPLRATAGVCFLLGKYGFVSADYEYSDYRTRFIFSNYPATSTYYTNLIKAKYAYTHNVRVGAELAWNVLRLRAGFSWLSSPYKAGIVAKEYNNTSFSYTGGIGYKGKVFFADLAYVYQTGSSYFAPYYASSNEPAAKTKFITHIIQATLGVRFGKK